nr:MAG TPA: hypothetical protein [Bacteriophage sp.]
MIGSYVVDSANTVKQITQSMIDQWIKEGRD